MITLLHILAVIFMVLGIFMMLGLTPVQITQDMMDALRPTEKLRTKAHDIQAGRQRGGLYGMLQRIRNTMDATGRGQLFPLALTGIIAFAVLGVVLAIAFDNLWLIPALAIGLGSVPILYMSSAVNYYEKTIRDELETALSIITNAYVRTDDIVMAVEESLDFIKPPLKKSFERFLQDSVVMASNKDIIVRLRDRVSNQVFYEWCTTLIQCQDDRTLKGNLTPVVSKLTDIRLINTQIASTISTAKTEYYAMVGFMFVSIPLMSTLIPGSMDILLHTGVGKFLVGMVADVILFTYFRMRHVTRPVEFDVKPVGTQE